MVRSVFLLNKSCVTIGFKLTAAVSELRDLVVFLTLQKSETEDAPLVAKISVEAKANSGSGPF